MVLPTFHHLNLAVEVPNGLFEVFDDIGRLQASSPRVLDGVPQAKAHVFGDIDALDARWMARVVLRVVDVVVIAGHGRFR